MAPTNRMGEGSPAAEGVQSPYLHAAPAVLPAGLEPATARISWDAGERPNAKVVLMSSPPRVVFGGARGDYDVPWIRAGERYRFALIDDGETLATATVHREGITAEGYATLLEEPEAYANALQQEEEAWSRILADPERTARRAEDRRAAEALRIGRHHLSLLDVLREAGAEPRVCLSVGCGEGRLERTLHRHLNARFEGVDIASDALEVAQREASAVGMSARYWQADLNYAELPPRRYDLIVAQTSLHHVLRLEHVIDQIAGALKPGGLLWVQDYVGESQFQYSDARLKTVNAILAALPEELTYNAVTGRSVRSVERRAPGTLVSPFESVRSGDIVPLLKARFEVVVANESDSIMRIICPEGTRAAFNRTPENRALFEFLLALDKQLVLTGAIEPAAGQYLLRLPE